MKPPKNFVFKNKNRKNRFNKPSSYTVSGGVKRIKKKDYNSDKESWVEKEKRIKKRDGNKCACCSSTDRLEVHHITPLSRGGTNKDTNLITLCYRCHKRRHKHLRRK